MRMKRFFLLLTCFAVCNALEAQQKWDLRRCIDFGLANNISVKQLDIKARIDALQYRQAKLSRYPNGSFNNNVAYNSGRTQDPTSFTLSTEGYLSAGFQLQTSADIFNWYSKKNNILANLWQAEASKASVDKLKDDIALSIANFYLQILLSREQENIASLQLQQSQAQLSNTRKLVKAGALPELNASELEAQVASDSASLVVAKGAVEQNTLTLKAYMNLDAAAAFEIDTPPAEQIPIESFADLQPDAVYKLALANLPQQRVNDFKLKAAQKNAASLRATMYPTISGFGSLVSNYALFKKKTLYEPVIGSYVNRGFRTEINNVMYDVQTPVFVNGDPIGYAKSDAFGTQLSDNFRQSIGLSISVPIFNGESLRTNWQRAKFDIQNSELQKQGDDQTLKHDIYQAYSSAVVAMEKFNASKKTVESSQRTYDFAQKRYNVGMLGTFELITNQNNLFRAKLEYVANQFDYVFKMKVLEFYKGQGLKF